MMNKRSLVMSSWSRKSTRSMAALLLTIVLLACGDDSSSNSNASELEACSSAECKSEDGNSRFVMGTMTDSRDGKTYKTVTIGSQTWMAENLNYNDGTTSSHCYRDDEINCFRYGRLYIGPRDMDCPDGWHIPRLEEWETLISAVGGDSVAGKMLKSAREWPDGANGSDDFGFSALPAGCFQINHGPAGAGLTGVLEGTVDTVFNDMCTIFEVSYDSRKYDSIAGMVFETLYYVSLNDYSDGSIIGADRHDNDAVHRYYSSGYTVGLVSVRCVRDSRDDAPVQTENPSSPETKATVCKISDRDDCEYGSVTDERDGRIYKTVKIGNQRWLAENLNYEMRGSLCYNDDANYCAKYGRLYAWEEAKKACPSGYHLPDTTEWNTLANAVGGKSIAGKILKTMDGWNEDGVGVDFVGFSALPAGSYETVFDSEGNIAYFWSSSTGNGRFIAYAVDLDNKDSLRLTGKGDLSRYSVRCLQGDAPEQTAESPSSETPVPCPENSENVSADNVEFGNIIDGRDGQIYKTVTIGSQTWMAENLNYETDSSFCYNDSASYCAKYGRLYTWAAAVTACPSGFHLPDTAEWNALVRTVGGWSTAGKVLKSTCGWDEDGNGMDSYGFSALPAGFYEKGVFSEEYVDVGFWSTTEYDASGVYKMIFVYGRDDAWFSAAYSYEKNAYLPNKHVGNSVRCIQD